MSSSSSPYTDSAAHEKTIKKRDRPPALDIPDTKTVSDSQSRHEHNSASIPQPSLHISPIDDPPPEPELGVSRSTSASSSLDPYYFGIRSPLDSPAPPLPDTNHLSATPETRFTDEPVTPAKDPANIDRRGLVGVGELATPRWARAERDEEEKPQEQEFSDDGAEVIVPDDAEDDGPDSPWTIEAIDGESDGKDESVAEAKSVPRTIRGRPSMTEESGGEEILYPRKADTIDLSKRAKPSERSDEESTKPSAAPPSSFATPLRKAKKRTSDEFEMDNSGALVSKRLGSSSGFPKDNAKEDKGSIRKHRSLGVGIPSSGREKGKERHRDSANLNVNNSVKVSTGVAKGERHARQTSASSSSSHSEAHHPRRVHTTDFSHLPPSPSSSSIQQFLRHAGSANSANTPPLRSNSIEHPAHSSPNVAHSLLRGTQEGWSGLDDEATAEALRKLDGLTGKTARARASVGSFGRPSSLSRPGTPSSKTVAQWEGVGNEIGKISRRGSGHTRDAMGSKEKEKDQPHHEVIGLGLIPGDNMHDIIDLGGSAIGSSDDQALSSSGAEKTPKKSGAAGARTSFSVKRGSTSSTTYTSTPTTSSRDSASLSAATSATSISGASSRYSVGKNRRNSAGSDVSSIHSSDATSLRDRATSAVTGDTLEDDLVPPVPPLPKDLSSYKATAHSAGSLAFSSIVEDRDRRRSEEGDLDRTISLEVPPFVSPFPNTTSPQAQAYSYGQSQHQAASYGSAPESTPAIVKTPSKKWSFSNALNLKLSSSPSSSSSKESPGTKSSSFPLSPRSSAFGQHLRKMDSKDKVTSPSGSKSDWSPIQSDAMASAASLASLSSIGSTGAPKSPAVSAPARTPDRGVSSCSGTGSSASTNHTTSGLTAPQQPLSPSSSMRRGQSSKRLTPSSIPFFRRSSSQSMQLPPSSANVMSTSPTFSSGPNPDPQPRIKTSTSPPKENSLSSPSTPGTAQRKSSVLSLGLPSLLKGSSSRRSLHGDKSDSKEAQRAAREAEKEKDKQEKMEKERQKKEDKERSESRISVLMGRRRGKTMSSTDPRKAKPGEEVVDLPPIHMSGIPPATAQRVARLKSTTSSSSSSTPSSNSAIRPTTSSRVTSQTVSSMQKQSDTSLRSRNQLPTIAGSPSVGTNMGQTNKETKEPPPSALMNSVSGNPKETPTKIPRISSRTSSAASPALKSSASTRRASMIVSGVVARSTEPSPIQSTNEFGVLENGDVPSKSTSGTTNQRHSVRASPSTTSRVPRQVSAPSSNANSTTRKANRDSISFSGLRKSSTGSVASITAPAPSESHHRFSALSPSKGLKLLSPKMSLPTARSSNSSTTQNIHQTMVSASSSRQSLSTPSPAPSSVDEEEILGDEEMMHYIRRQQTKKMASGATQEELDDLLRFPEPLPPATPATPAATLKSGQLQHLSEYERREILDYPSVYCIGARSQKKPATTDNSTNNYGYDDERGDYLVVNHDHLAYRYEVIDTLGKGSFGQVLHCRDHCTGESVAIKIIRNKKRFHHQALVEIKILDNLRKWDNEEKHHVIKMTEHFYFRNHLCIAMELLSINLYELIKANGFVGFTTTLIRRFTSQLVMSLQLMRHHRIVHCDLKPENVLLRHPARSGIKVIDFGSSCFEHEKIYTYIQSRFYRSPEVILGMNYHMAIDMWSLGCILAELYTGFPIFPGENEQEQLSCIMEVLGIPDKDFVNRSSRKRIFFDNTGAPRPVVNSKGRRRRPGTKSLAQVLRCSDEEFVDFISKCLVWDPERRIKPQAAMRHPFLTAGRRGKISSPSPATAKGLLSSNTSLSGARSKPTETPKKSQISAPTPLTARSSRTATTVPSTPGSSSGHANTLGSSRSYRQSQPQGLSTYHSSRTLTTAAK